MTDLVLPWKRCEAGTVLRDRPRARGVLPDFAVRAEDGEGSEVTRWLEWASGEAEPVTLRRDPKKPLLLRFVNATTPEALRRFADSYGLPTEGHSASLASVEHRRDVFRRVIAASAEGREWEAAEEFNSLADREEYQTRPRLILRVREPVAVLRPSTPLAFMLMELMERLTEGHRLMACQQCGAWFIRQRSAVHCGNTCRVAAFRQRNPEYGKDRVRPPKPRKRAA